MVGRPPGAQNKDKPFKTALMLELKATGEDMPELRKIARQLIERAMENNSDCREIIDRLDGKVPQESKTEHSGEIGHKHTGINITIVDPAQGDA